MSLTCQRNTVIDYKADTSSICKIDRRLRLLCLVAIVQHNLTWCCVQLTFFVGWKTFSLESHVSRTLNLSNKNQTKTTTVTF